MHFTIDLFIFLLNVFLLISEVSHLRAFHFCFLLNRYIFKICKRHTQDLRKWKILGTVSSTLEKLSEFCVLKSILIIKMFLLKKRAGIKTICIQWIANWRFENHGVPLKFQRPIPNVPITPKAQFEKCMLDYSKLLSK